MDDFVLYFYLCWIVLIVVAFFTRDTKLRVFIVFWILLIISSSNVNYVINDIEVFAPFLLLFVGAIIYYIKVNQRIIKLINVFIVMIAVVAILLWQLLMPIWYLLTTIYFLPVMILLIIILLVEHLQERLTLCLIGVSSGQLFYDIIVMSYHLNYTIGIEQTIIQICIIVLSLLIIHFVSVVLIKIKHTIQNRYKLY